MIEYIISTYILVIVYMNISMLLSRNGDFASGNTWYLTIFAPITVPVSLTYISVIFILAYFED